MFEEVTARAGIGFRHTNGATGRKWLPETMGSGVCWLDFDNDGWQDLFFVNGMDWQFPQAGGKRNEPATPTSKLFRNRGDDARPGERAFEDVSASAGLALRAYGMGVCVGDYDNDGRVDLYVTALGRNYLFHNEGDGRFREVAQQAGVADSGWSTSCAWVDYDEDGRLDLFVCHYVRWRGPQDHIPFSLTGDAEAAPSYNTPEAYAGESCKLFHNEGKGKFKEVSAAAGITKSREGKLLQGKSLGVTLCDFDRDGHIDLVVANDKEPNYLFRNLGTGKFEEVAIPSGIAVSSQGTARAAMGIHAADFGNTGREGFVIGNFTNEMLGLYENKANGLFIDIAPQTGVGAASRLFLSFGCFFADFDNDGWQDIFVANGHVADDINRVDPSTTHAQRPLLVRNGSGRERGASVQFEEVGQRAGPAMSARRVARGAAAADYDLDGRLDVALAQNNGAAVLLRNRTPSRHGVIRVSLVGARSNRAAIGAELRLQCGNLTQMRRVQSGGSYCSQAELPVTFGLGSAAEGELTITWPRADKRISRVVVKTNRWLTIDEVKGVVAERPLPGQ